MATKQAAKNVSMREKEAHRLAAPVGAGTSLFALLTLHRPARVGDVWLPARIREEVLGHEWNVSGLQGCWGAAGGPSGAAGDLYLLFPARLA